MIINLVEAVAHPDKSDPTGEEPIILRFVRHDFTPDWWARCFVVVVLV